MPAAPLAVAPEVSRKPFAAHPVQLDRDRRAGVERVIELARWAVLVYAGVANNFPGQPHTATTSAVNLILGGWCLFNLSATLALIIRHLPGRNTQIAMLAMDLAVASALVYLTGGFISNLAVVFYVLIGLSSLRFGVFGSLLCAMTISALYVGVGLAVSAPLDHTLVNVLVSRLFLFFVVSLASALLAREMVMARAQQMAHTAELEHAVFAELREVDRIKSEFMMLASHELRTPLTKIKAWLALMQDAGDHLPAQARQEGFHELRTETEHLGRLTDNLLCIAQLESGEIRLRPTTVDFTTVLRQVVSRFVEVADRGRFLVHIDENLGSLFVDEERLVLVLACLIDNALKFAPDNDPVEITALRVVNKAHIEVRDNGRRIPDGEVERVFASFYQVENPLLRQRGGFGVGLYLARQLVERMGGRIWLDNQTARGNSFFIAVPLEEPAS
ncbi:MAG: ATP-binding protein [Candidatus Dormibacteria bacterium]|jgi:signal transduction histidine kinase